MAMQMLEAEHGASEMPSAFYPYDSVQEYLPHMLSCISHKDEFESTYR